MVRILQYGEGNFLRSFVEAYFQTLNDEGGAYEVYAVKPRPSGSVARFAGRNCIYHVILRGSEQGKVVERVREIRSLRRVFHPIEDRAAYEALAEDPELKLIVSNTTEAGIAFCADDAREGDGNVTFPAKLTRFLYRRFRAGLPGVYLLPAELIDDNAGELRRCVERYIALWGLEDGFRAWNAEQCFYCGTLVDRIVSGYPRDEETRRHLEALIGEEDPLMTVAEPFGLWAVENKGGVSDYLREGAHDVTLVLTDRLADYRARKVRVLNGSHTNLVAAGLLNGAKTVFDCVNDPKLTAFIRRTLERDILPYVSDGEQFAADVLERFANPYLNHRLTSIALNSVSKWRARVLPTVRDAYAAGAFPAELAVGLGCLLALYRLAKRDGEAFYAVLPSGERIALQDEPAYLQRLAGAPSLRPFLADEAVWGEPLTKYPGFAEAAEENAERIGRGECLL